jgi:hypothetical protein
MTTMTKRISGAIVASLFLCAAAHGGADEELQYERWHHPSCQQMPEAINAAMEVMPDGSVIAVDDNAARVSRDEGKTWSKIATLYDGSGPGIPDADLHLLRTRDGVLIAIYMDQSTYYWKWDAEKRVQDDKVRLDVWAFRSLDEGKTWVDRQMIMQGYAGAIGCVIETQSGHIVAAVQDMMPRGGRNVQLTCVSADKGKTWQRSNIIDLGGRGHHDGAFEGTVAQLSDGRLLLLMRTSLDRMWEAYSDDNGYSWRVLQPSKLDASSAPGYLKRLSSGRLVFVWSRLYPEGLTPEEQANYPRRAGDGQHSHRPVSYHREALSIAFSEDDGRTWTDPVVIVRQKDSMLSYPRILERRVGELWISTRYNRNLREGKAPDDIPPVALKLYEADFVGRP